VFISFAEQQKEEEKDYKHSNHGF